MTEEATNNKVIKEPKGHESEKAESQAAESKQEGKSKEEALTIELEAQKETIETLNNEISGLKNKNLRLYADFENYKKRVLKEKEDLINYGNEDLILKLLPIIDHLEMAVQHSTTESDEQANNAIKEGVELILKDLLSTLNKFGLEAIASVGEPFDPLVHHAMNQIVSEEKPENTVVSELRKGYKLHDKVLRASLVSVSKKPEQKDNKSQQDNEGKNIEEEV